MKRCGVVAAAVVCVCGSTAAARPQHPHLSIPRAKAAIAHADFREPKVRHCQRLSTSTVTCTVREIARLEGSEWIVLWEDIRATRTHGNGVKVWSPDVAGL